MPVVINEFEVLEAPPAPRQPDAQPPAELRAATPLQPEDLRQLLARCAELQLRRFAH